MRSVPPHHQIVVSRKCRNVCYRNTEGTNTALLVAALQNSLLQLFIQRKNDLILGDLWSQEQDLVILLSPFQLKIFCDSKMNDTRSLLRAEGQLSLFKIQIAFECKNKTPVL